MKRTVEELDAGQLDLMWAFLRAGFVKSNIKVLKQYCVDLRQLLIQKTGGQPKHKKANEVSFDDIGTICNSIVIEAMALYLSGDLDLLEKIKSDRDVADRNENKNV